MLTVVFLVRITGYFSSLYIFSIFYSISFNFYSVKVINPKKWRQATKWEWPETSSRKLYQPHSPAVFQPNAWIWDPPPNSLFLCSYCLHCSEHQLHLRPKQDLLHLLVPPHCSELLLWLWVSPLSHANFRIPSGADLLCAVWCGHSHGESPHLQPEEQGSKGSCEKNTGKIYAMVQMKK